MSAKKEPPQPTQLGRLFIERATLGSPAPAREAGGSENENGQTSGLGDGRHAAQRGAGRDGRALVGEVGIDEGVVIAINEAVVVEITLVVSADRPGLIVIRVDLEVV